MKEFSYQHNEVLLPEICQEILFPFTNQRFRQKPFFCFQIKYLFKMFLKFSH